MPTSNDFYKDLTKQRDFRDELDFLVRYRAAREQLDGLVERPDTMRNRFIQFCLQNRGRLSAIKRARYFSALSDDEVRGLERVIQEHLLTRPISHSS